MRDDNEDAPVERSFSSNSCQPCAKRNELGLNVRRARSTAFCKSKMSLFLHASALHQGAANQIDDQCGGKREKKRPN